MPLSVIKLASTPKLAAVDAMNAAANAAASGSLAISSADNQQSAKEASSPRETANSGETERVIPLDVCGRPQPGVASPSVEIPSTCIVAGSIPSDAAVPAMKVAAKAAACGSLAISSGDSQQSANAASSPSDET